MLVLLLAAAVCSLLGAGPSGYVRSAAQMVLLPLSEAGTYAALTVRERADELGTSGQRQSRRERDAQKKIEMLQFELQEERAKLEEHLRIDYQKDSLYGRLPDFPCTLIPARVLAWQSLPYGSTRVVRASSARQGSFVTTLDLLTDRSKTLPENLGAMDAKAMALVGRLISTGRFTAELQLVTDSAFQTKALIWRDPGKPRNIDVQIGTSLKSEPLTAKSPRIPTMLKGNGSDGLIASEVLAKDNVQPGDWLMTTGGDGFMPDRIAIGRVSEVKADPHHLGVVDLVVKPTADLDSLREVYIVLPRQAGD